MKKILFVQTQKLISVNWHTQKQNYFIYKFISKFAWYNVFDISAKENVSQVCNGDALCSSLLVRRGILFSLISTIVQVGCLTTGTIFSCTTSISSISFFLCRIFFIVEIAHFPKVVFEKIRNGLYSSSEMKTASALPTAMQIKASWALLFSRCLFKYKVMAEMKLRFSRKNISRKLLSFLL